MGRERDRDCGFVGGDFACPCRKVVYQILVFSLSFFFVLFVLFHPF